MIIPSGNETARIPWMELYWVGLSSNCCRAVF